MKNYGKIHLGKRENFDGASKPTWIIECEPHVALRLRRLFGRAERERGTIQLLNNEEVCRDLVWFLERYPMEASASDIEALRNHAESYNRRIESYERVLNGDISPRPFQMTLPARPYQAVATELWLRAGGLLVADELGLGKTVVAIAGLSDQRIRPALIVVPTHLQLQWKREIERFIPGVTVHILKKGTPYDVTNDGSNKHQGTLFGRFPDVLISTYHKLDGWADHLAPIISSIVFDEVQELRRTNTHKYHAAEHLAHSVDHRLGLSATPIFNYGGEMYNVMNVLRPDALGSREEFTNEWCAAHMYENKVVVRDPKTFGSYLRDQGLMIRRTRKEVGRDIPALTRVPFSVDADPTALKAIEEGVAELARIILEQGGNPLQKGQAARELDWRLRQATGIGKAPFISEFVKMLLDSEEKIVLFGWHRTVYDIWLSRLKEFNPVLYTGSETPQQKDRAVQKFTKGNSRVMIVSLRSGSGLDGLQYVCKTGVVGELDWSPGVHEQCDGRIARDGQEDPVFMYYGISDEGSDPVVADVLQIKTAQIDGIRRPNAELVEKLQVDPKHIEKLARHYLERTRATGCAAQPRPHH
jgi:SNF2 family DNA or RNA helicase